jgi:hypothetical protein
MSTFDVLQLETVRTCMDELGDGSQITITRAIAGALNTATGVRAATTTSATMTAIASRITSNQAPGDTRVRRMKFTVLAEDCVDGTPAAFRPDENDRVTWKGVEWHVDNVEARCGDQVYDLSCSDVGTLVNQTSGT